MVSPGRPWRFAQVAAPRRKECPFQTSAPSPADKASVRSLLIKYSRVKGRFSGVTKSGELAGR
jgi:hypothetical protein